MKNKSLALALALLMLLLLVPSGVFAVDLPYTYDDHWELIVKSNVDLDELAGNFYDYDDQFSFYESGTYEISMKPGATSAACELYVEGSGDEDITLILNGVVLNINEGDDPYGINAEELNSLNIELVGENKFLSTEPDANDCGGIYTDDNFPVHIYGSGSLEISGCGIGDEEDYFGKPSINVSGDLTLGKAGDSRTSLIVNGMGTDNGYGYDAIYCEGSMEIVNADVTVNHADDDGIDADDGLTIKDSTIKISDPYSDGIISFDTLTIENSTLNITNAGTDGIDTSDDTLISGGSKITISYADDRGFEFEGALTIENSTVDIFGSDGEGINVEGDIIFLGNTEISVENAGSAAILADEGGIITLGKGLAILSPENGEIVSFSYEDDGMFNAQTIAPPNAAIEYDDGDNFFTGASQSVKIGKGEPEPSFLEQLLSFFKKLAALINYLNTGIVVLPSEF